jgi:hypothetical protein
MGSKKSLVILLVCLLLIFIAHSIGTTMGYFNDTESSLDNTMRIAESW